MTALSVLFHWHSTTRAWSSVGNFELSFDFLLCFSLIMSKRTQLQSRSWAFHLTTFYQNANQFPTLAATVLQEWSTTYQLMILCKTWNKINLHLHEFGSILYKYFPRQCGGKTIKTFGGKTIFQEQSFGKNLALLPRLDNLVLGIFPIWVCIIPQNFSSSVTLHCIPCSCTSSCSAFLGRLSLFAYRSIWSEFSFSLMLSSAEREPLKVSRCFWPSSKFSSLDCWLMKACIAILDGNLEFRAKCLNASVESFA